MIVFPNCKINLGLHITRKRPDGFHDLETVFYPLPLTDALEVVNHGRLFFGVPGLSIPGKPGENSCMKAWELLKEDFPELPMVNFMLFKNIPIGAGLGGGSADAAFMLTTLNELNQLNLSREQLLHYAAKLGSDCPFFIYNEPCYATGRGEILEPFKLDLSQWTFVLVNPGIHVNTGWAFGQITPQAPAQSLRENIQRPVEEWKDYITNDFETPIFSAHPELQQIKEDLYAQGAVYACMSGSGSTMVGMFPKNKKADVKFNTGYKVYIL
jgi:4-diphosphocytidyl-2-C-methyl-D-erythritol kinase